MIVTVQRLYIDPRKTVGQMTVGNRQCCTLEKPMRVFHSVSGNAIEQGQYPLIVFGDALHLLGVEGNSRATIGLDIEIGRTVHGGQLVGREGTLDDFYPLIAAAIRQHNDVMLEIINIRR